jgi:dihydrofolate synthase/folylpolyglutamate synthase
VYWSKDLPFVASNEFEFTSPLPGLHQGHNLSVAAAIVSLLGISQEQIIKGIAGVYWPGRLETIDIQGVKILMDCAHNPAGIRAFRDFIRKGGDERVDLTFGVLDTKNWQEMVRMLAPVVAHWRLIEPESERALPLDLLEQEIKLSGIDVRISRYGRDYEGLIKGILNEDGATKFLTGSMYMVGRVREVLGVPVRPLWKRVHR